MRECIGLFGHCGRQRWRDSFIERYEQESINYYNPFKDDYDSAIDGPLEASNMAENKIVVFPITNQSFGMISLNEVSIATNMSEDRHLIVLVDDNVMSDVSISNRNNTYSDETLASINKEMSRASVSSRNLVRFHLEKLNKPNVHLVSSLDDMLELSVVLYREV